MIKAGLLLHILIFSLQKMPKKFAKMVHCVPFVVYLINKCKLSHSFAWLTTIKMVNGVPFVVYFDQQMYACSCIFMAENIEKHLKMVQIEPFSSFAQNVHLKLL